MIKLTPEHIEYILDFLTIPNSTNPYETELSIYNKKKQGLARQLQTITIYEHLIPELKREISTAYQQSLITPGECVGIIGAQSMGEYTTQATLNTFHFTGLNVNTGASRFQELLNASKAKLQNASKVLKQNTISIRFNALLSEDQVRQELTCVYFENIVSSYATDTNDTVPKEYFNSRLFGQKIENRNEDGTITSTETVVFHLSLRSIYQYRIYLSMVKDRLESENPCECLFLPFGNTAVANDCHPFVVRTYDSFDVFRALKTRLFGMASVKNYVDFTPTGVTIIGGTIKELIYSKLRRWIDFNTVYSANIWEIYNTLGIEAVKFYLIEELKMVMKGINICHIKLLVDRMTFTGTIKPITRYTMRNDEGPLGRASFEESMETFIRAAKYKEKDLLTGVSASVIVGKKPTVGSYSCDLLMNLAMLSEIAD